MFDLFVCVGFKIFAADVFSRLGAGVLPLAVGWLTSLLYTNNEGLMAENVWQIMFGKFDKSLVLTLIINRNLKYIRITKLSM